MSTATFSEVDHRYELDGVTIPSVTQVLTLAGISDVSGIPFHILERARQIGLAAHEACQFLDEGDLDLDSIDPAVAGFVVGYQRFKEEKGFTPSLIEHRTSGEWGGMKYGMCLDRLGEMTLGDHDLPILLDIKTSSRPQPSWSIQTAAYADGLGRECYRGVVHVAKDGTYKLLAHADDNDFTVWRAALTVAHWRMANGAKLK